MDSMSQVDGPIHLGLDVAKNAIVVGVLLPGREGVDIHRIGHDEASVHWLVGRFDDRSALRVCYEAGPTGFGLYRLLRSMGVACDVVAPSLIPRAPGDRVKTDKRDARRLARLHRSGQPLPLFRRPCAYQLRNPGEAAPDHPSPPSARADLRLSPHGDPE
jgi:transposase